MTADGTSGAKGQPQFLDGGAPDLATDSNILADYAAKVGNRRVGTTAERNAAAGKDVWEGLEWDDTTTKKVYRRIAGSWVQTKLFYTGPRGTTAGAITPPDSALIIQQFFHAEPRTNGASVATVNWPTPFPNGVGHPFFTTMAVASVAPVVNGGNITLTGVQIVIPNTANQDVRLGVHVWGW